MLVRALPRGPLVDIALPSATPRTAPRRVAREVLLVGVGVLLLALSAHLAIRLPFSPVPITGQTFAVLLLSAAYGWRRGTLTVLAYLAAGFAGAPVFAAVATTVTYGYLVGFVAAALVVGWLAEHGWDRSLPAVIVPMLLGEVAIYACGLTWLARFTGWDHVVALGLTPFLIGDALKLLAAVLLLPAAWLLTRRMLGNTTPTAS